MPDLSSIPDRPDSATKPLQLCVVIPVHNEGGGIASLLAECCAALRGMLQFEIVVVDDCSTDDTLQRLQACHAAIPELRILRHRRNAGQSMALVTGIHAAHAPIIATLDGDGQNDPADILLLWKALVAAGERGKALLLTGHRQRRQDSWLKRLSSRIAMRCVRGCSAMPPRIRAAA
jgi:dolichol-phosphate mannosyltransferase